MLNPCGVEVVDLYVVNSNHSGNGVVNASTARKENYIDKGEEDDGGHEDDDDSDEDQGEVENAEEETEVEDPAEDEDDEKRVKEQTNNQEEEEGDEVANADANLLGEHANDASDKANTSNSAEDHKTAALSHKMAVDAYHIIHDVKACEYHTNLVHQHLSAATEAMLSSGGHGHLDIGGYEQPTGGTGAMHAPMRDQILNSLSNEKIAAASKSVDEITKRPYMGNLSPEQMEQAGQNEYFNREHLSKAFKNHKEAGKAIRAEHESRLSTHNSRLSEPALRVGEKAMHLARMAGEATNKADKENTPENHSHAEKAHKAAAGAFRKYGDEYLAKSHDAMAEMHSGGGSGRAGYGHDVRNAWQDEMREAHKLAVSHANNAMQHADAARELSGGGYDTRSKASKAALKATRAAGKIGTATSHNEAARTHEEAGRHHSTMHEVFSKGDKRQQEMAGHHSAASESHNEAAKAHYKAVIATIHNSSKITVNELSSDDKKYGAAARRELEETGNNPASWVKDESKWEEAKGAAEKQYDKGSKAYWPVVTHIYRNMGGKIKGKKSKRATENAGFTTYRGGEGKDWVSSDDYDPKTPGERGEPYGGQHYKNPIRLAGYQARAAGSDRTTNPHTTGTPAHRTWHEGWDDHQFIHDSPTGNSLADTTAAIGSKLKGLYQKYSPHAVERGPTKEALTNHYNAVMASKVAQKVGTPEAHEMAMEHNKTASTLYHKMAGSVSSKPLAHLYDTLAKSHSHTAAYHHLLIGGPSTAHNASIPTSKVVQDNAAAGERLKGVFQRHAPKALESGALSAHYGGQHASRIADKAGTSEAHSAAVEHNDAAATKYHTMAKTTKITSLSHLYEGLAKSHQQVSSYHDFKKRELTGNQSYEEIDDDWMVVNAAPVSVLKGEKLSKSDFAYTPSDEPSTWKLRIDDAHHVGGAIAAIGKGFRGSKVSLPEGAMGGVKSKIHAAWKKFHKDETPPDILTNRGDSITDEGNKKKCWQCNGTGKCWMCKGKGSVLLPSALPGKRPRKVCSSCGGSGKCKTCKGTGSINTNNVSMQNFLNDNSKESSAKALEAAKVALMASKKTDADPEVSGQAFGVSKAAHKSGKKHHHKKAAGIHGRAADTHDDLMEENPDDADDHESAASHHRMAKGHHEEAMSNMPSKFPTDNCGGTNVANKKHPKNMSDTELHDSLRAHLQEKNKRDIMGFDTYFDNTGRDGEGAAKPENDGVTTPAALDFEDENLNSIDWEAEFEGQGLSHNAEQQQVDNSWFNKIPKQYQEAVRNAAEIVNRERGALLRQLVANMNDEQKHYTIQKFKESPIEDLRKMVSIFAVNNAAPPPLTPIYAGAAGGPIYNQSTEELGDDAMLPATPTINFQQLSEEKNKQGKGKRATA